MQLLVIKEGTEYFRFTDKGYERCPMQKASVYPLKAEEKVRLMLDDLRAEGIDTAAIYCLTITEEPFA